MIAGGKIKWNAVRKEAKADLANLRLIWARAGRPGQRKFRDAATRAGLHLSVKESADFLRGEGVAQVFAKAPESKGKITSPQLNERWMCDLLDYKSRSPDKNDGNRMALVCIDVFSRMLYAELLKTKEPGEVAEAFKRIQREARGRVRIRGRTQVIPKEVSTDSGAEFKGVFSDMLADEGISQRFKESTNSLAVVDAAINWIKTTIAKTMGATATTAGRRRFPSR